MGTYTLQPTILDVVTQVLHWDLQCGNLQSPATDLGFRDALIAPMLDLVTQPLQWDLQCGVGTYNIQPLILDLVPHSLHWDLQCENLQTQATHFGTCSVGTNGLQPPIFGSRDALIAV